MKICAIARVILKAPLTPNAVRRESIRNLDPVTLQTARAEGKPYKLLTRATVNGDGSVSASVRPEQIATNDPLGNVRGTSLAIHFELDTIPGLTIVSHRPNLQSTAYGLLADFINALK
jgi:homoserine dehydrogenase